MCMASRVQRNALVLKKTRFLPENGYKYVGLDNARTRYIIMVSPRVPCSIYTLSSINR